MNYNQVQAINALEEGTRVEGFYIIKSVSSKITTNKKKFLDIVLGDKTGSINAKLWDCTAQDEEKFTMTSLVKVRGVVTFWLQQIQIKIERIRLCVSEDNVDMNQLIEMAPIPKDEMYNELMQYIDRIKNEDIKKIVSLITDQNKERFTTYPAAKRNHHAIGSGLLYHTLTMLRAGEKMSSIYTFLNTDLLYAGVILHDMAKVWEMEVNQLSVVDDYSTQGYLLGHIIQGITLVDRAACAVDADQEISDMLKHMILAHHYEAEFGSPKKPMFAEAEMLHYLDIIDSKMYDIKKATDSIAPGKNLSERIWTLERRIYKPPI